MAEPLSITTAIITFYSAIYALKKYKDSYTDVPAIIEALACECDLTLEILLHTKWRLYNHDKHPTPDNTLNPVNIRARLGEHIARLYPEVKALTQELATLLRPSQTNYDHIKSLVLKPHHRSRLGRIQGNIVESRKQFDRLLRSIDG